MVHMIIELFVLLFVIGIFACVFAGGKTVICCLEWLVEKLKKLVK